MLETLRGPTCSAACSHSSPTTPRRSGVDGPPRERPPKPRTDRVGRALMNVASSAHITASHSRRARLDEPGAAWRERPGVRRRPHRRSRGRSMPTKSAETIRRAASHHEKEHQSAAVTKAANHVTPRIDWAATADEARARESIRSRGSVAPREWTEVQANAGRR